jgi:hypothetical protein
VNDDQKEDYVIIWLRKLTQPVTPDINVVENAEVGVTKTNWETKCTTRNTFADG